MKREIKFLTSVITRKEEAILNEEYMQKCHDSFLRIYDKGGLILMNIKLFDFWAKVVRSFSSIMRSPEKLTSNYNVMYREK